MSAKPSVFRVVAAEGAPFELHMGEMSAGRLGWANENDIPPLETVGQIVSLLAGAIGVCELKVEVTGSETISSDDEGECVFTIGARSDLTALLARAVAPQESARW